MYDFVVPFFSKGESAKMNALELVPQLVRASFEGNKKMIEATALMIIKKIKKDYPNVAEDIAKVLSYADAGASPARALNLPPLPVDQESRYSLIEVETPQNIEIPILDEYTWQQILDFIKERELISQFLQAGIVPPNSLLMCGSPGVGKTYIAHWIAAQLNLPLLTLDLATSISSYLGRSGQNIRSIFEYAKAQPSVLFLDELDAIAKRRDDAGDLGELKRLVNVLLKEIENYSTSGMIIAATNHPELLDKAIWRRFDRILTVPMPEAPEREKLLYRHLDSYANLTGKTTIDYIVSHTHNVNAADICKLCEHIKRQFLLNPDTPAKLIMLSELFKISPLLSKNDKIHICKELKTEFPQITQREISKITQIPLTTVSRYLSHG